MNIELIRSRRRTLSIELKSGRVLVRAPLYLPEAEIRRFIREHEGWIEKRLRKQALEAEKPAPPLLTEEELKKLKTQARAYLPERCAYYADILGVHYSRITIRAQHTRWGSCSARGGLSFNCLLMLMPAEAVDAVVVHELCHLVEMNHSPAFYALVRKAYPAYDKWNRWLRKNGPDIMRRLP